MIAFIGLSTCLHAQEPVSTAATTLLSQDAPRPDNAVQIPDPGTVAQVSASITGTIRDADGVAVPGARVTLAGPNNAVDREVTADNRGAFTFSELGTLFAHTEPDSSDYKQKKPLDRRRRHH
jgi:hypothetical protein